VHNKIYSERENSIACTLCFAMASLGYPRGLTGCAALLAVFLARASGIDIFLEWNVALDNTIRPVTVEQPV
jgi:hypothetical protein